MSTPHRACWRKRPSFSFRPVDVFVNPILSGDVRVKVNSVVSWITRIGPSVARTRWADAAKWPARILSSLTLSLAKKR